MPLPNPHRPGRLPPAARRRVRLQAWALALLLLVTQQWGLAHWLKHCGSAAPAAGVVGHAATVATAKVAAAVDAADAVADAAADTVCATCLALAGLGALALPPLPVWTAESPLADRPAPAAAAAVLLAAGTPFQARAPPVLS